jgi:hypothetical protein
VPVPAEPEVLVLKTSNDERSISDPAPEPDQPRVLHSRCTSPIDWAQSARLCPWKTS